MVRTRPSGRARDSGRDTFEKENLIKCKIKELNGSPKGFGLDPPTGIRVGIGGSPQALPQEVSSARRARPHSSPSQTAPTKRSHILGCRGPIWVIQKPTSSSLMGLQYTIRKQGQIPFASQLKINLKVWLIHRIEIGLLPMVQMQPNIPSRQDTTLTKLY